MFSWLPRAQSRSVLAVVSLGEILRAAFNALAGGAVGAARLIPPSPPLSSVSSNRNRTKNLPAAKCYPLCCPTLDHLHRLGCKTQHSVKVMQGDNGVLPVATNPSPAPTAPILNETAAQKAELVRQFASAGSSTDGGLIAQLTSNPFFTAVSLCLGVYEAYLTVPGLWTCWSRRRSHCRATRPSAWS